MKARTDVVCMDARNLLEYDHALRNRYLEQFSTLPWEEVVKGRGASFDSLRNILLHIIDVEDRNVNYIIPGRSKDWAPSTLEEFHDVGSIKKRALEVEGKTNTYLAKMTPDELERKIEFPMWGKAPVSVRVEDILIHVVFESVHHFGELIALLWQMDVVPPHMGWINYAQDKVALFVA